MGKLINGIYGSFEGKVGTVVGSSWKGIPYIKSAYKQRTKKVSEKELANRNKFAMAQAWLKPLLQHRKGRTADRIVLTTIENI